MVAAEAVGVWVTGGLAVLGVIGTGIANAFRLGRLEGAVSTRLEAVERAVDRIEGGSLDRDYRASVDHRLTKLELASAGRVTDRRH